MEEKSRRVYFNLDIGHWLTRAEKGKPIQAEFINIMKKIPPEYVYELHLNDYVPKRVIFHPPLIDTPGLLNREVLETYFEIVKNILKPEVIVLETAFNTKEQVRERWRILEEETAYVRTLMAG